MAIVAGVSLLMKSVIFYTFFDCDFSDVLILSLFTFKDVWAVYAASGVHAGAVRVSQLVALVLQLRISHLCMEKLYDD
jgi:hypothetical protein